jgi:myo-inositol 2-dehydrogenase / D-chiro-inositol 1-dehydrogenase
VNILVIGCGGIANSMHGPAYARYAALHDDIELAACCDIEIERAEAFAGRFGFRRVFTDWERMLESASRAPVVCLNVPPERTASIACQILRRGIPLLIEKPPGLTVIETDEMIRAAGEGGAPHQVAFNRRYNPLVTALKSRLAQDSAARIELIQLDFTRIGRKDSDFSTTAIHGIDTVRFLAGYGYAKAKFNYSSLSELGPTVVNIYIDCLMVSGTITRLNFLPATGAVTERLTLYLRDDTFFLNLPVPGGLDFPGRLLHLRHARVVSDLSGPEIANSDEDYILNGFYAEDASFFDALRNGDRPTGDLRESRQSVEIAQSIRERKQGYP